MSERKVILVEHRPYYRAVYGLNLNLYLGVKVEVCLTVKEVLKTISDGPVELIFIDTRGYSKDIALNIQKELTSSKIDIPMFIIGKTEVSSAEHDIFDQNTQLKYVVQAIASNLEVTAKQMADQVHDDYFPLPMEFVVPGWFCASDLFQKTSNGYETIITKGDVISEESLEDLEAEGVQQLYVSTKYRLKFVNSLTHQISAKLNDPTLTKEEKVKVIATAHQMVMEQARSMNVSDTTLSMANDAINVMGSICEEYETLEKLYVDLAQSQSSYRYKHSLLITFIGTHIIKKMPWSSKEQQQKFAFVAFFHDIALRKDSWAKFHSDEQVMRAGLTDKEREVVLNHAMISAKIISKFNKIPFGTDTIIKQHHGNKTGKGLSNISSGISPLSIVFIFSEEWANIVLLNEDNQNRPNKKDAIQQLQKKYDIPAFNKILPILHSLEF